MINVVSGNKLLFMLFVTAAIISGCAALLPSAKIISKSPWKSYQAVVDAYDNVIPNKSSISEIRKLGFDIYSTPNLKILSYVDIAVATSTLKRDVAGDGIEACLRARGICTGYVFEPQVANSKRYGNFWLDMFNFRRKTLESGWRFRASFLVVDSVVVEKYWYGEPQVNMDKVVVNPLGPLQDWAGLFTLPKIGP